MKSHSQDQLRKIGASHERLTKGLGWFSIGLGLVALFAPRALARLIGAPQLRTTLPALGLREIIPGIGILSGRGRGGWLWARVLGDIMDLRILGEAFSSRKSNRDKLQGATVAVIGVTLLDILSAMQHSRETGRQKRTVHVAKSITIERSPEELYQTWRNFENLARFMPHVLSVSTTSDRHSHWVVEGPAGKQLEWDSELTEDHPNERIAWRSMPGADLLNSGSVTFEAAPAGRGTVVRLEMSYTPPGGMLGKTIAKLFHKTPEQVLPMDLHRFKQMMETGQITTTEGQSAGRSRSTSLVYDDFVRS